LFLKIVHKLNALFLFFDPALVLVEAVRTMPATILAAIAAFEKVLFGEDNITLVGIIKIIRLQVLLVGKACLFAHLSKDKKSFSMKGL
jgi:hypothetical protein